MLPFIPRNVARSLKVKAGSLSQTQNAGSSPRASSSTPLASQTQPPRPAAESSADPKGKLPETQKPPPPYKDYAALLLLSFSSHILWANPDLQRAVETGDEGYVPLAYLVAESPYFCEREEGVEEGALVRAARACGAGALDVRMIIAAPSRGAWYGRGAGTGAEGGYEVRVGDGHREDVLRRAQEGTRQTWEAQTVYMENIPPQHRSIGGIFHFVGSLLQPEAEKLSTRPWRVQSISLPRHPQDKPNAQPKCKGFALVTLADEEDVRALLSRWPWRREPKNTVLEDDSAETQGAEQSEAAKFGFKVLEKSEWDKLNEEYLAYRQTLLDEISQEETAAHVERALEHTEDEPGLLEAPEQKSDGAPPVDLNAPYPPNCLVFVRNVHPETNKTTLRKLFLRAFEASEDDASGEAIDYVDFNKGMSSCYLRLSSPRLSQHIVSCYTQNPTAQAGGLDGDGSPPSAASKAIAMELVTGPREELYWGKVPEKIRRQAVAKAVGVPGGSAQTNPQQGNSTETRSRRKRKRG